jgi:hypothetical protein
MKPQRLDAIKPFVIVTQPPRRFFEGCNTFEDKLFGFYRPLESGQLTQVQFYD